MMEQLSHPKFIKIIVGYAIILTVFIFCIAFIAIYDGDPPNSQWYYGTVGYILGLFTSSKSFKKMGGDNEGGGSDLIEDE